jgi:hypothetical protein
MKRKAMKGKDPQIVELAGRNRLASELQRAGIEVARPERDHGVDLVAFLDRDKFRARPIQLKAASRESFDIHCRYAEFPELMLVYVWNVDQPVSRFFALAYAEAEDIAQAMGWTSSPSWRGETTGPAGFGTRYFSPKLRSLLDPYEVKQPEAWMQRLFPNADRP